MNGVESYVWKQLKHKKLDWFPKENALCLRDEK